MPWTASRPAPQKSIVLRLDGASLQKIWYIFFRFFLREGCQTTQFCRIGISYNIFLLCEEGTPIVRRSHRRELWEQDVEECSV